MAKLKIGKGIAFIGGGNMAEALIKGLIDARVPRSKIFVSEPVSDRRRFLKRRYGIAAGRDNARIAGRADTVLLAVKPQMMDDVLVGLRGSIRARAVVVSIAAGIKLKGLERGLGDGVRIVRTMPNTPALVGRGATVICGGTSARRADLSAAAALFETVGLSFVIDDEKYMDAVTGLSGSGPAYVYAFAEALIKGGVACGLDVRLASELVLQTIAGAAEMMSTTGTPPDKLRLAVSSPGGTTLAGLASLSEGKFDKTVASGVKAATRRSRELGRGKRG